MKLRQKRNLENLKKQKQKYPNIARKIIEASDIILQILDARFIEATRNLELEKIIKNSNKKIINVINKFDLINKSSLNKKILSEFYPYCLISCKKRTGIKNLRNLMKKLSKTINIEKREISEDEEIRKLSSKNKISIGIIGYPNTGKSSLINLLIGKSSAITGAEAGVTKGFQKLKLTKEIVLIDTPGIIPKNIYSEIKRSALTTHTKLGGRGYSQIKEPEIIISEIMKQHKGVFEKFYNINAKGNSEILIEKLGKRKNFLTKGGEINTDKTARLILRDWQEGRIKI